MLGEIASSLLFSCVHWDFPLPAQCGERMCRPDWALSEPYNRLEKEFRRIQELIYGEICVWTIHSSNHKNNKDWKVSPRTPTGTELTKRLCLFYRVFLWYSKTEHFTGISSQIKDKVCQVPVVRILTPGKSCLHCQQLIRLMRGEFTMQWKSQ